MKLTNISTITYQQPPHRTTLGGEKYDYWNRKPKSEKGSRKRRFQIIIRISTNP